MDFAMAKQMQAHGLQTIVYDALTRYRKTPPSVIKTADLYIAQNFCGVGERLAGPARAETNHQIVSPIVPESVPVLPRTKHLLNL